MKKCLILFLPLLMVLVTGCPHNEYSVELTPKGNFIHRQLGFSRVNGTNDAGAVVYENFPEQELEAIRKAYPFGKLSKSNQTYKIVGEFEGAMPNDLGGCGSYTNISTSLGNAGFYMERFRGSNDLVAMSARRLKAADQMVDLVIGWSGTEFGREANYKELRKFLDGEFRSDVKNLTLYMWSREMVEKYQENAMEEYLLRYGQFLMERGYLQMGDLAELAGGDSSTSEKRTIVLVQRLVAKKLGMAESGPMPHSLAILGNRVALEKSWQKYLETTELYKAKLAGWEKTKRPGDNREKPKPDEVMEDLLRDMINFRLFETDDHMVVKLTLPGTPVSTNGKWDESAKQVTWENDIEAKEPGRLPAFCYANWAEANGDFQKDHFGKVALKEDRLFQYCLWRNALTEKQGGEWDDFVSSLKAEDELVAKVYAFRFSESGLRQDKNKIVEDESMPAKELIKAGLQEK
jgi:hypothetical protein